MRFRFRVGRRAQRQINAAAKWWAENRPAAPSLLREELETAYALMWWAENRPAAPSLLREELETAYALIASLPFAGEAVAHSRILGLRRVLLNRTQYHVYYVAPDNEGLIEVLAFWHTHRAKGPPL